MRIVFILFSTLFTLSSCLHHPSQTTPQLVSFSSNSSIKPEPNITLVREGYQLGYDGRLRNASWVYEELTAASFDNNADRTHFDFMEDPAIPPHLRSTKADYQGSGYDRGHLRPAANAKSSDLAMQNTFYLSNISPQHPQLNRKYWLKLEKYVRDLTRSCDIVYVLTGPLFLPTPSSNGKRYVHYEVIGPNDVAVPTHFFKLLQAKKGASLRTEAYIIPNTPIANDPPLQQFSVTTEKVAKAAGITFRNR